MSNITKNLLLILKFSKSQKEIYNILLKIFSDIKKTENSLKFFRENDGLNHVIKLLSKPNKRILNISLGILTYCCSDSQCREEILSRNILKHLALIMRYINQDVIHYRCCKFIGNLAHCPNICSLLISNEMYELVIPVLNGNPSAGTQLMAIRSLRCMLMESTNKEKKLIARPDIIEGILKYLSSSIGKIQKSVLQIVLYLSSSRCDMVLKQVINENTLELIVSKADEYPSFVLRIFFFLSEIKYFHFGLAKVGVLETIFSHIRGVNLKNFETISESKTDLVLQTIYKLCNEPKCREKLCSISDAFNFLLDVIENSSYIKLKKYSVLILSSFMYDEPSLKKLVKKRLILTLISYLQTIVNDQGLPHDKGDTKNNDSVMLENSPNSYGRISPLSDCETSMVFSPSPKSEPDNLSPTESIDSVYSPVYSPIMDEVYDSEDDIEKLSIDNTSCNSDSPLISQVDDTVKSITEEKIFSLLKHLIFIHDEPLYDLCAKHTWETLLDYLTLVRKTNTLLTSLLSAIAGNRFFLNHLLQSQFALAVHKKLCRPTHIDCHCCQEMNRCGTEILFHFQNVAESSYGNQILRNESLKKGYSKNKLLLALTIPHIVKNIIQLEEYLIRYKILQLIIDSLNDDNEFDLFEEKVACLNSLANSVCLTNPRLPCTLCEKCDVASLTKEATINFLLDDGSTVTANKRSICEKSEFFEAMFRCGFKEAKQATVRLANISEHCLTVLFRLLHSYCDCILPKNVVILLELIVQSDRFLIPTLSEKLLNITMNSVLDYENCYLIYDWALECGSFVPSSSKLPICQNIVKYALIENITFNQRVNSFKMLLNSRYKLRVLKDIMQVIEGQLKCNEVKRKLSIEWYKKVAAAKRYKIN